MKPDNPSQSSSCLHQTEPASESRAYADQVQGHYFQGGYVILQIQSRRLLNTIVVNNAAVATARTMSASSRVAVLVAEAELPR